MTVNIYSQKVVVNTVIGCIINRIYIRKELFMSFAERVKSRRIELKLTQARLAELSDMAQQSLQKIESGKTLQSKKLINIAKALNCTPEYLLFGTTPTRPSILEFAGEAVDAIKAGLGTPKNNIENITPTITPKNSLPLISWVQAGNWSEIGELHHSDIEHYLCPVNCSERSFVLKVQGASMLPKFKQGDHIFIDPDAQVENGSYVVARLEDENQATFKQLIIEGEEKFLKAVNPDWPTQFLPINGNCTIVGKVIYKGEVF